MNCKPIVVCMSLICSLQIIIGQAIIICFLGLAVENWFVLCWIFLVSYSLDEAATISVAKTLKLLDG